METIKEWIFSNRRVLLLSAIAFLAASLSFGAGFSAAGGFARAPIIIEECATIHDRAQTLPVAVP